MLMSGDTTDVAADVSYTSSKHIVAHSGLQYTTNILKSKQGITQTMLIFSCWFTSCTSLASILIISG